ncbi:hypothetical protein BZA05DRAFT_212105 [Tricharina praecox]|uniref:uncharacterized protein n=1 Tax=Tricharina praecox TaxID=43433 RepID=UPI0022206BBE|nr:uncharacterized protein BZA05DRAFT_212105 [Tricharina praecox]KAI5841623.1 hypothetical protein BZA05DRAFT_212105 [Tricharina praecox]
MKFQIREFHLLFEKHSKLLVKYARTINDPDSDWTDLTNKNFINMMVNVLRYDENTSAEKKMGINPTILHESARALTTLPADSREIWAINRALIEVWHDGRPLRRADSSVPPKKAPANQMRGKALLQQKPGSDCPAGFEGEGKLSFQQKPGSDCPAGFEGEGKLSFQQKPGSD